MLSHGKLDLSYFFGGAENCVDLLHISVAEKCEREIFARRAMVDQAQECLRYQRKILNILEVLNIEKLTRSVFWLIYDSKLCDLLPIYHCNN